MRHLLSLALGLLALQVALAQDLGLDVAPIASAEAMCPQAGSSEEVSCAQAQACITSQDCSGDAVCCPSACGRSCKTPNYNAQKSRNCPWVQTALAPKLCQKQNEKPCIKDNDCEVDERCCFDGCALQCTRSDAESPLQ